MKRAFLAFVLLAGGCQSKAGTGGGDSSTSTSTSTESTSTETSADESASMEGSEATSTEEESESTFTEEESESTFTEETSGETGEDEQTCRDVVACVAECAVMADDPLSCLFVCGAMAPPAASQEALELTMCLITSCVQQAKCTFDLGGEECPVCLLVGLIKPDPEGCEEEAAACE